MRRSRRWREITTFSFHISREANLFHVINNLAAWHHSCRRHYNEAWLRETGPMTEPEQAALRAFAAIARECPYGDRWVGRPFTQPSGRLWDEVAEQIGADRTRELRAIFAVFEERFTQLWESDHPRLLAVQERLEGLFRGDGITAALQALSEYLAAPPPPAVTIHLLTSRGAHSSGGGANEIPGHITLEVLELADQRRAVAVAMHEVAHLMEAPRFVPLYAEFSARHDLQQLVGDLGLDAHWLIKEALNGAIFPKGVLSHLVGLAPGDFESEADAWMARGDRQRGVLLLLTGRCVPLVGSYFEQGRAVDAELFEQALQIFRSAVLPATP